MPKFNLDEDKTLHDSLEFTIDGKTFIIQKLNNKILDKMDEIELLTDQFALLANVDTKETADLDLRKVAAAIRLTLESVTESLAGGLELTKTIDKTAKKKVKKTTVKNR